MTTNAEFDLAVAREPTQISTLSRIGKRCAMVSRLLLSTLLVTVLAGGVSSRTLGNAPLLHRPASTQRVALPNHQAMRSLSNPALTGLTLPFIANRGQMDARVAYYAPTFSGTVYVTRHGQIVYSLPAKGSEKSSLTAVGHHPSPGWTLTERLLTQATLTPQAEDASTTGVSYFVGKDKSDWHRNLPTSNRVSLGEAWPGIWVSLTAHGNTVETFYRLEPRADVRQIRLSVSGATHLRVQDGALIAATGNGPVTLSTPKAWQVINGMRHWLSVSYALRHTTYRFRLGPHDPAAAVVIDPEFQATYLGGSGEEQAQAIALDTAGEVYVAGYTYSTNFPGTTGGAQPAYDNGANANAFIAKLNPGLTTLDQATYLGGSGGERAQAIALDTAGDVYVTGFTYSTDFPGTTGGAQPTNGSGAAANVFIAKLNSGLTSLDQATYLGGSSGSNNALAVALDAAGDVYVAGATSSTDFPGTTGGAQPTYGSGAAANAFIAKLNSGLTSLDQATYLGGSSGFNNALAVALDAAGDVYVAGETTSTDMPGTTGGAQPAYASGAISNAYVAKLNPGLTVLDQATYLGGNGGNSGDQAQAIALDSAGDVYVAGGTGDTNFPGTTGGAQPALVSDIRNAINGNAFIAKLNPGLTTLDQATYLGGSGNDEAYGLVLDAAGDVYVAGTASSSNFPGTTGGVQTTKNGSGAAFIAKLNPGLTTIDQATYLGGSLLGGNNLGSFAQAVALDRAGDVYVAGYTDNTNFYGATGGAQPALRGSTDAFIAKLPADLKALPVTMKVSLGAPTQVNPGSSFNYALKLTNNSSNNTTAFGVVLTDTLPSQLSLVSLSVSPGFCSNSGATLTCTILSLAPGGGSATEFITVRATGTGKVTDTAQIIDTGQNLSPGSITSASASTMIGAPVTPPPPTKTGGSSGGGSMDWGTIIFFIILWCITATRRRDTSRNSVVKTRSVQFSKKLDSVAIA